MAFEIVSALILGVIIGIVTGLIPGLHVNLLSTILFALSATILNEFTPWTLACFIISISITHTFIEFITAIYLGAPDDSTALSILPGHKMLLEGRGYAAVYLSLLGAWGGLVALIALSPLLIVVIPFVFSLSTPYIGMFLLLISAAMILRESSWKGKLMALMVYLGAGSLGCAVFALDIEQPLFPLLSGLFGVSTILSSIAQKITIPKQELSLGIALQRKEVGFAIGSGLMSSSILSIFPGLGPAQAAIIATQFYKKIKDEAYLVVVGSINTIFMAMSLLTLYSIDKARNGSIVIVQQMVPMFTLSRLIGALLVALCAGSIALVATLFIAKRCSVGISKIPYEKLSCAILLFIVTLVFFICGLMGVFVLVVSAAMGLIPMQLGVGRHHAMGVLLVPIILYFLL